MFGLSSDGYHDLEEEAELVQRLRDTGYLHTATRGIPEQEKVRRKKDSHKKWRRNNTSRLQEERRARTCHIRTAPKIAKRAAQIAVHYREKLSYAYRIHYSCIYQKLYSNSILNGGRDPMALLDIDSPPTESTFPLMVCLFLPNCDWPKVVPAADLSS